MMRGSSASTQRSSAQNLATAFLSRAQRLQDQKETMHKFLQGIRQGPPFVVGTPAAPPPVLTQQAPSTVAVAASAYTRCSTPDPLKNQGMPSNQAPSRTFSHRRVSSCGYGNPQHLETPSHFSHQRVPSGSSRASGVSRGANHSVPPFVVFVISVLVISWPFRSEFSWVVGETLAFSDTSPSSMPSSMPIEAPLVVDVDVPGRSFKAPAVDNLLGKFSQERDRGSSSVSGAQFPLDLDFHDHVRHYATANEKTRVRIQSTTSSEFAEQPDSATRELAGNLAADTILAAIFILAIAVFFCLEAYRFCLSRIRTLLPSRGPMPRKPLGLGASQSERPVSLIPPRRLEVAAKVDASFGGHLPMDPEASQRSHVEPAPMHPGAQGDSVKKAIEDVTSRIEEQYVKHITSLKDEVVTLQGELAKIARSQSEANGLRREDTADTANMGGTVRPRAEFDMGPVVPVLQAAVTTAPSQETVLAWKEKNDYSEKYCDDVYEYRRVTVPRAMLQVLPPGRTMTEAEWRNHGITMSRGWEHYGHHSPEANVLLFRRVIGTHPKTGQIPPNIMHKASRSQQGEQKRPTTSGLEPPAKRAKVLPTAPTGTDEDVADLFGDFNSDDVDKAPVHPSPKPQAHAGCLPPPVQLNSASELMVEGEDKTVQTDQQEPIPGPRTQFCFHCEPEGKPCTTLHRGPEGKRWCARCHKAHYRSLR